MRRVTGIEILRLDSVIAGSTHHIQSARFEFVFTCDAAKAATQRLILKCELACSLAQFCLVMMTRPYPYDTLGVFVLLTLL
jgi:hypothetical protein